MKTDAQNTEKLIAYLRDELPADEAAKLEKRLMDDAALRRMMLEISVEEAELTDWAKAERVVINLDDETFRSHEIPAENIVQSSVAGWRSWAAIAAALLVLASVTFLQDRSPKPALPGIARIVASVDADWSGSQPNSNHPLTTGEYQLAHGSIDLEFVDGAKVSVSGPARFILKSASHLHLYSGNLVANIPDEALGFVVTTPESEVIDLGTEFGVSVSGRGQTDVHVLDGLVKVLPIDVVEGATGILVKEGQARRFQAADDIKPRGIPVSSREGLLGAQPFGELGLKMLRGSVRLRNDFSSVDFSGNGSARDWIGLVPEQREVVLKEPLEVTVSTAGNYRDFEGLSSIVPAGTKVNSYLLHFHPNSFNQVHGVIRFDEPVLGILSTGSHLGNSDAFFGIPSVKYPSRIRPFRGLEPSGAPARNVLPQRDDWKPDEVILSQDRRTVAIRATAYAEKGLDQVRILTLSK